ncbi:Signal transduction histidine kinase internal region domain-containing protein [Tenacibaculum sp. 190524A05c]
MRYNSNVLKKSLFHIYFLLLFLGIHAQDPISIHITDKDGFPDNEIYDLLQDKKGDIWIAANKGLFKFDGKNFTQLTHPKKQGRSFFNLTLDPYGRVWCNNLAGQFFYVEENKLELFGNYQNIIKGAYTDFVFLNDQLVFRIYLGEGAQKVCAIDIKTKEKRDLPLTVTGTSMGFVFNDILYYTSKGFKLKSYDFENEEAKLISDRTIHNITFSNFYKLKEGFCLIKSNAEHRNNSFYEYDNELLPVEIPRALNTHRIEGLFERDNNYYFSTSNGMYICTKKNNSLKIKDHYLKGIFVTKALIDVNNNLWISTLNNSIYIIPNEQLKKISNVNNISVLEKINDSSCYIGTRSGKLLEYYKTSNIFKTNLVSNNSFIRSISFNKKAGKTLYASDKSFFTFDAFNRKDSINIINTSGIKNTDVINDSTYVVSSSSGVYIVKGKSQIARITFKRAYTSLFSKSNNQLYVSDVDGLNLYSNDLKAKKEIKINQNPIYTFKMTESTNEIVWVSTYDKGIYGIKNGIVIKKLNEENGLASNFVNTINTDGNDLWIATEKGVQLYNSNTDSFKILTKQDGINSYAIKHIEVLGNDVLLSSNLGLFSFDKTKIFKERKLQKPYIKSVQIQEKDTLILANYKLPQESSNVRFNFNIKGFHSNQSIIYQYILKGVDKDWITLTRGSDYVKFNSLPEGDFELRFRIIDEVNGEVSEGDSINIKVTLPFYKTELFWLFSSVVSIMIVIFYFRKRTRRLKETQKIQLEKAEINRDLTFSQLENLRSQMNPHFIFNALNSIQDYIIINEKKLARDYLVRFAKLIRLYLDQSRKNEISLEDELSTLNLYLELEKERFEGDFDYEISVDEELIEKDIYVPSLLIQPYVENALKHGLLHKTDDKKLEISFVKNSDTKALQCTIVDNGIGRESAAKINEKRHKSHVSFATSANQKRVTLLNSAMNKNIQVKIVDLYDEERKGIGTVVTINLPL